MTTTKPKPAKKAKPSDDPKIMAKARDAFGAIREYRAYNITEKDLRAIVDTIAVAPPLPRAVREVVRCARDLIKAADTNDRDMEEYRESHPQAYALYKAVRALDRQAKAGKGRKRAPE